jgi:hypothetical protein
MQAIETILFDFLSKQHNITSSVTEFSLLYSIFHGNATVFYGKGKIIRKSALKSRLKAVCSTFPM